MNYIKLTQDYVKKALKYGASAAEVYLETSRQLSIQVLNGELETIEEAASAGIGFRVIVDKKMGFSHCNDLSTESLENTLKRAIEFAKLTTADPANRFPEDKKHSTIDGLYDPNMAGIPMEEKIDRTLALEKLVLSDPRVSKSSGAGYSEGEEKVFIANSNGVSKTYQSGACSIGVSVVAEKGEQKNTGGEYCSRRFYGDLLSNSEIAEKAAEKAARLIDPQMVKTQRAPIIVDTSSAGSFFGGVIGALNGERVEQGASFLKDSLEKQIVSELITLVDDGLRAKALGSTPFDGEGVPVQTRTLIQNGVLKGFIYNTFAAQKAGVESTGNASRRGFTSLPGIGTHNIYVEAGTQSREEIIAATDKGLLVTGVTGYGINSVSGNFSGGASGLWIENGKIKHPVKGLTIAGSAEEVLMGIDMLGNDLDLNKSFSIPTFRIKELMIGGA